MQNAERFDDVEWPRLVGDIQKIGLCEIQIGYPEPRRLGFGIGEATPAQIDGEHLGVLPIADARGKSMHPCAASSDQNADRSIKKVEFFRRDKALQHSLRAS